MSSTNAKTRDEILAEMARLSEQLDNERAERIADVKERIAVLAQESGVTPEVFIRDHIVGDVKLAKRNAAAPDKPRRGVNKPKYASPYNADDTWAGGTGPKPKWWEKAIADGYTPEMMLIEKIATNGAAHA